MLLFLACAKYANLPADTGCIASSCSKEDTSLSIAVVGDIVSPALSNLYCAVSGSLIDPNSEPDFIFVNEKEKKKKICGNYYKCCIPCSCDVMKYSEVQKIKHKFSDGTKEFFVFTIKNPCNKKDFPNRVNKDYFCNGDKINDKQVYSINDHIVIGLLHDGKNCEKDEIDFVKSHKVTGRYCELRNNTPLENLNAGMGDISVSYTHLTLPTKA